MTYHAVHNRCVIDFASLSLAVSREEILALLKSRGFQAINVDVLALARSYVGRSIYRRCAFMREAPLVVDCASLIKWLYGQRGIWLPRDLILWLKLGVSIQISELAKGDLIFTDGYTNRAVERVGSIGHVGVVTDCHTIIHATNKVGIEEISFDLFLRQRKFCCAKRIIANEADLVTLSIPLDQEIEISNDFEWILFDMMKSQGKINQPKE